MEARKTFNVDGEHCRRAEDELYEMLLRQDLAFSRRWSGSRFNIGLAKVARAIGLTLSLLGLALCLAVLIPDTTDWSTQPPVWFVPLFAGLFAVFCFQPRLTRALETAVRGVRERSCRRHAARLVRGARQQAPFEAAYELKEDLFSYERGKNGQSRRVWQRQLSKYRARGLAFHGASVSAIFRRPTSFLPSVVILKDDSDWLAQVLKEAGVAIAPTACVSIGRAATRHS